MLLLVLLEINKTKSLEISASSFLRSSRCIYHWKLRYNKSSWFVLAVGRGRSQSFGCMYTYTRELHALWSLFFIHQSTCIEATKRKAARQDYDCGRFSLTFSRSTKIQPCCAICVNIFLLLGNLCLSSYVSFPILSESLPVLPPQQTNCNSFFTDFSLRLWLSGSRALYLVYRQLKPPPCPYTLTAVYLHSSSPKGPVVSLYFSLVSTLTATSLQFLLFF